jgi:uncharacterized protein
LNKKKIINDPVYGFITFPTELIYDIISEPVFQRLRRIKQLGLTELIYPGAHHTRFHHAIGAMHLMMKTLENFRSKGHHIWEVEYESACLAILLHDIGHGPFSHALEHTILKNVPHEKISLTIMEYLNKKYEGKLRVAIDMFTNNYQRPFFYQLISSQLDMDRLDYLRRDCYFTGVSEGTVASERIIKMMDVVDNELVVEEKGIYSIENFLNARRLMYWQVYLHKTAVAAEQMLISCISRAQELASSGEDVFATPSLKRFLYNRIGKEDLKDEVLADFMKIDDMDVWGSIKVWSGHSDKILSFLANSILERKIFKIELRNENPSKEELKTLKEKIGLKLKLEAKEVEYFISTGVISNKAYISKGQSIKIKTKNNELLDIAEASDLPNIKAISKIVKKYYISYPKTLDL